MAPGQEGTCRSCGQSIRWIRMESGRRNPLNPAPDPVRGNVRITGNEAKVAVVVSGQEMLTARHDGEPLYLSHFATCPNAERHRRPHAPQSDTRASSRPPSPTQAVPEPEALFDVEAVVKRIDPISGEEVTGGA